MNKQFKHIVILFTLLTMLLGVAGEAWAANRTIKAVATTGCEVRVYNGSSWGNWTTGTATATVADNKTAKVEARMTDNGHAWSKWTGTYTSTNNPYSWTVTKNATLNANVTDTWTENLIAGATYTVTTVSGNYFKVTCSNTSAPSHNKNYTYIGNLTASSGTVTVNFNNTATVWLKGQIKVTAGTLNLRNANNNIVTFKRNGYSGDLLVSEGGTLNIQGNSGKAARLVIDGGAVFPTAGDARSYYNETDQSNTMGSGRLVYATKGAVVMKDATLQNNYNYANGSGISLQNTDANATIADFNLENVTIQGCWATHGSAIYIHGADLHGNGTVQNGEPIGAIIKNVIIQKCFALGNPGGEDVQGGIIRTNGGGRTKLTLDACEICNNKVGNLQTGGYGAGIYWNACGATYTRIILKNNTKIHDNEVETNTTGRSWAGGIMIESRMTIESAEIYNNKSKLGGGIFLCTYGGGAAEYEGQGFDITLTSGVKIYNNTATEIGGGLYLSITKSRDIGYSTSGAAIDATFQLHVDGGEIYGNHAPLGGGVAVMDMAPNKVIYFERYVTHSGTSETSKTSGTYIRQVNISAGSIHDNYTDGGDNCGAGIYIKKYIDPEINGTAFNNLGPGFTYAQVGGAGTMSFTATGGLIYGNGVNNNTVRTANGGAFYITDEMGTVSPYNSHCNVTISKTSSTSVNIYKNKCTTSGGAIYVNNGKFVMEGGTIGGSAANANVSSGAGGGFYITGNYSEVEVKGGTISYNQATTNGGGFYVQPGASATTYINSSEGTTTIGNNQANKGGGVYVASGNLTINGADVLVADNQATVEGGGIWAGGVVNLQQGSIKRNKTTHATTGYGGGVFVNNSVFNMTGGVIGGAVADSNSVCNKGGGVYITGASAKVLVGGGEISYNTATASDGNGGGIYVNQTGSDGTTISGGATVSHNKAKQNGGGLYVNSGNVNVTNANISSNQAGTDGGGLYANGGSVTMTTATLSSNSANSGNGGGIFGGGGNITVNAGSIASNQANSGNGGGVYATSGTITFNSTSKAIPTFTGNTANNGGVLFMEGGTCNINAGTLGGSHANRNKATENGGAIYVDDGTVNFATGTISYNTAGLAGGGLYVDTDGTLNMTGNVTLDYNHVPASKHGGGVYLAGVIQIGSSTARTISAQYNFADGTVDTDPGTITISSTNRNNVYLPVPELNANHTDVITVVKNGLTTSTRVGFSVPSNFVPVIYCNEAANYPYLESFLQPIANGGMKETVFDDAEKYTTVHYSNNSFYDPQHIYLSGGTWVDHVSNYTIANPPAGFSVSGSNVTVSSSDGLAWLIKYINGIAPYTSSNPGVSVTVDADLDMGDYAWVPIASVGASQYSSDVVFTGTFNGNGHTISNIICQYLGTQTGTSLGMFGTVGSDATVENVHLKGAKVNTTVLNSGTPLLGSVAGQITGGTIQCCVSEATISTLYSGTVMGGIVGQQSGGTVHSCFSSPKMTGYEMGGLVGQLTGGNLYNSFANPQFTYKGSGYMGGLVGVNQGTVENCYIRLLGTAPASNFGWLVGDNTNGNINYSYSPNAAYTVSGKEGTQAGLGTYSATTSNAYDYKIHDNQVTATNNYVPTMPNKQLVKTLNNWVTQDDTHGSTYSKWLRTTSQFINGDYPLLRLTAFNAVAATNGEAFLDYGDINNHIDDYKASNQAICLYGSRADVVTNVGINTNALLYIDQEAVLTQAGDIQAYVGVTLDNSAGINGANPNFSNIIDEIDWHFFSSVLTDAPIGLVYGDNNTYGYGEYPTWNATFTAPNAANGYFPTNLDNYYNEWDLYAYCEGDYHWINLKRNSNSHWHEDFDHEFIDDYTNETIFTPGHGFMVALAEENYLQAYGMLNTHTSANPLTVNIDYSPWVVWTTRQGHNLLGNPYQSYLDFNDFASANSSLWSGTTPFYVIIDEDKADYVLYVQGQSANESQASRYLHPHQGFMIVSDCAGTARFHDGMRKITMESGWTSSFRGDSQPNYPLVNLFATDDRGNRDIVTVELGRPDKGGAPKHTGLRTCKGSLSCHYEDEDYSLVFTQPGLDAASIRFVTDADGEYTMTWNTQNGNFSYLHLIDNMTGSDIDCLTNKEYKFTSSTTDYASRFRLVFDYTGIEEPETPETVDGTTSFAFMMNGELVVNGEGTLQLYDLSGRMLATYKTYGTQSTVNLPEVSAGVYLLRLTSNNGTRTQKIILD